MFKTKEVQVRPVEELVNVARNGNRSEMAEAFGGWLPKLGDEVSISFADSISDRIKHYGVWIQNLEALKAHLGADVASVQQKEAEALVEKWKQKFSAEKLAAIKAILAS